MKKKINIGNMGNVLINLLANRLFVILVLFLLILAAAAFVYFFIIPEKEISPDGEVPVAKESEISPAPQPSPLESPATETTPTPQIQLTSGEIRVLSQKEASDPWLSLDGRYLRYLFKTNGTVYQIDTQTRKEEIFTSFTPNLIKILWSPNGYHLLNIYKQSEGELNKYSYNSITKENTLLNKNFKFIAWSPQDDKIAYHYFDPKTEEGFMSIAGPDGKNWENLTPVLPKDLKVDWPKRDKISFYLLTPSNLIDSDLHIINPETVEPLKKLISKKYGLEINWSPSGDKLLFSASEASQTNPKLFILNETLEERVLNIEGLADKCVWSKTENYVYCALPQNISKDINLPQDWYSDNFLSQDILFRVDLASGEKTQITKKANYDFSNLLLNPNEEYLYFINKESEFLYEVKL